MINRKVGFILAGILISILVGIPMLLFKHKKPDQQATVVAGLSEGQQKTFQQDLSGATAQFGYIKKGDSLFAAGRYDEAIREYEAALSLARSTGSRGEALRSLANLHEKKRDYKKALEYTKMEIDNYMSEWAKAPLVERAKYLEYASMGNYDLAVEHAKKAINADIKVHNSKLTQQDYQDRLNDLISSKDYILSLRAE